MYREGRRYHILRSYDIIMFDQQYGLLLAFKLIIPVKCCVTIQNSRENDTRIETRNWVKKKLVHQCGVPNSAQYLLHVPNSAQFCSLFYELIYAVSELVDGVAKV